MAENQFSVNVPNLLQAITLGEQGYKDQRLDNARNQLQSLLSQGGPIDLQRAAIQQLSQGDMEGAKTLGMIYGHQIQNNGVYGNPIMLQQADGSYKVGAIGKNGQPAIIDFGQGNSPTVPSKTIDTGTGTFVIPGRVAGPQGAPVQGSGAQPSSGMPTLGPQQGNPSQPQQVQSQGYFPKDVAGAAREGAYGKEVAERQATLGQAKSSLEGATSNIDRMSDVARSLMTDPALDKITGWQGVLPNFPGGRASDAQARLNNLTSQAGFAVLQAMRDASKTGGALGSVSDFENRQLQNNLAALSQAQSAQQYRQELQKLIQWGEGVKQRLGAAYQQDYSNIPQPNPSQQPTTLTHPVQTQSFTRANPQGQPSPTGAPQAPRMGEVRDGYRFKGGNPADESSWVQLR